MSKRQKFVLTSVVLSLGFFGIQFLEDQYKFLSIGLLGILTLVLFVWSLWEVLGRDSTLLVLVLPLMFTLGVGFFWFLLPASIFARLPVLVIYGVGIYSLCLTANIYTVSAIRTIGLLRAARGVGFILTILTTFLIFDSILSLRSSLIINFITTLILSFPLFLQGLWTVPLERHLSRDIPITAFIFSLATSEVALSLYFWPVTVVVGSLFLTLSMYMLLGLGQAKLDGRLFSQTIREYLTVGVLVFVGMYFATRWG